METETRLRQIWVGVSGFQKDKTENKTNQIALCHTPNAVFLIKTDTRAYSFNISVWNVPVLSILYTLENIFWTDTARHLTILTNNWKHQLNSTTRVVFQAPILCFVKYIATFYFLKIF